MALEEFLRQIRDYWQSFALDLVSYQNKCRLIRGWEDLFTKCTENLGSLSSMKASPYFKIFEEEALAWEDKLNRVHVIFDIWIDVQRQWVYLEGIFNGATDIKTLLPLEASRFANINTEFMALLKKVYKSPLVLDVINISGVQKSLEKLAELLVKIQKALGEYLEKERSSFPRFYFVGDEDLLEIIGNGKDITRIQKHLKKMFAGVSQLLMDEEGIEIKGVASAEAETISLKTPIRVTSDLRINDILLQLDKSIHATLAHLFQDAYADITSFCAPAKPKFDAALPWIEKYPDQLAILSLQALWTTLVEESLSKGNSDGLNLVLTTWDSFLDHLSVTLTNPGLAALSRSKCQHLITVLVHHRDVTRLLIKSKIGACQDFSWQYYIRVYNDTNEPDLGKRVSVHTAGTKFTYGFEYIGVPDRLVQTPLTDKCYLAMTQALNARFGGSPFGPAGTGKTETVKALGNQLGKFVLVFCCDETFDFQAVGRIFVGLCQVGAWGCFDEFNRLDEKILSAVSQQVQIIQEGLRGFAKKKTDHISIELLGRGVELSPSAALFITMNPGYAGRSNLPNNLKKLFRPFAMTKPDNKIIAEVMLFAQGFRFAEMLASKIVPLFALCKEQLSAQPHYDFGLRALKSVLTSAGNLKRLKAAATVQAADPKALELSILVQSVRETVVPKLITEDIQLLYSLLEDVFPGVNLDDSESDGLRAEILKVCQTHNWVPAGPWIEKIKQLYQIQNIHHGIMLVGSTGSGKSSALSVLLSVVENLENTECMLYRIDPKAVKKEQLYGTLDSTTREWSDGLFTQTLRKIIDNVRGEKEKRHWIVFDGDVDPEWVENLNR